jgi:hypothetical protein
MSRRRIALVLGAAVLITVLVPAPAGAQTEDRKREHLELECRPVSEANAPAVACKWSASSHPDLAGYRLFRAQRWMGQVVYRGKETSFVDHDVRPGRRYFYVAQAIGADGRPLGRSNAAKVKVPPDRPERLKLDCSLVNQPTTAQVDVAADRAVACKWSASSDPAFDHYRLGRFGRGGRQVAYRGKDTEFVDREIRQGNYRYVVGAFSASGRLLGWSNWAEVRIPPQPEPKPVPKPEPKPRPEPEHKARPRLEPKPRPEPEPKPLPRPERKPEPRPVPPTKDVSPQPADSPKPAGETSSEQAA